MEILGNARYPLVDVVDVYEHNWLPWKSLFEPTTKGWRPSARCNYRGPPREQQDSKKDHQGPKEEQAERLQRHHRRPDQSAIKSAKASKALGLDGISNVHLKHLGPNGIKYLTNIFNTSTIPTIWKSSTIIPLLKPYSQG